MSFPTPEAAAAAGIPEDQFAILDVVPSPDGAHAVVLLDVNGRVMEALCVRDPDGWQDRTLESAPGWSWVPALDPNGVHTVWAADGFAEVVWDAPAPSGA